MLEPLKSLAGGASREAKAAAVVQAELWQDEQVLWVGQPTIRRLTLDKMKAASLGIAVIAVVFGLRFPALVTHAQEFLATRRGLLVALGAISGCAAVSGLAYWWWARWAASDTIYAVTDRRILTIRRALVESVNWISRRELADVRLTLRPDGTGDLLFRRDETFLEELVVSDADVDEVREEVRNRAVERFVGLPDAQEVLELVRQRFPRRAPS